MRATAQARREARDWLAALRPDGGTEMLDGVKEALGPLRAGAQRQVVLVTDGLVGFETEIVRAVAQDLPPASRLHAIALGSAPNRALTGPVARAGRGVEVMVGLDEEAGPAIAKLLAHLQAPVLTDVRVDGPALLALAPARLPDVYAGAPLRVALKLRPEGGKLHVRGKTVEGTWEERVDAPALAHGEGSPAVAALYGREAVADIEMREAAGLIGRADREIEQIGLDFQIATRATAWVAVSEEPTVDRKAPIRRERIPHALPHGTSAEGLGLRSLAPPFGRASVGSAVYSLASESLLPGAMEFALQMRATPRMGAWFRKRPTPVLPARLTLRTDRELVLEITVADPVDWYARDVRVIWGNGTELAAAIVAEATTRPGRVEAGQVIRLALVLEADGPAEAPVRIELTSGGSALHLSVHA